MIRFTINDVKHPKYGANHYCGPSAISILTGIDTKQAAGLLRIVSNSSMIKGTYETDVNEAMKRLGFTMQNITVHKTERSFYSPRMRGTSIKWVGPTLRLWMAKTKELRGDDAFLVVVGDHWVVIQGNRRCCGISKEVVFAEDNDDRGYRYMGKHVDQAFRVIRQSDVSVQSLLPTKRQAERPGLEVKARRTAKKLAQEYEIDFDYTSDNTMPSLVYPPEDLFERDQDDPHEGNHTVSDWFDVLAIVQDYVRAIKTKHEREEQEETAERARTLSENYLKYEDKQAA